MCGHSSPRAGMTLGRRWVRNSGSSASSGQVSGEKTSGARRPEDVFFVAAFADDHRSFAGKVHVFDVEREDFPGPGGGLVQHPPQGLSLAGLMSLRDHSVSSSW